MFLGRTLPNLGMKRTSAAGSVKELREDSEAFDKARADHIILAAYQRTVETHESTSVRFPEIRRRA